MAMGLDHQESKQSPSPLNWNQIKAQGALWWILKLGGLSKVNPNRNSKKQSDNSTSIKIQMLVMLKPLQIIGEIILRILKNPNSILNSETNNCPILNFLGN